MIVPGRSSGERYVSPRARGGVCTVVLGGREGIKRMDERTLGHRVGRRAIGLIKTCTEFGVAIKKSSCCEETSVRCRTCAVGEDYRGTSGN